MEHGDPKLFWKLDSEAKELVYGLWRSDVLESKKKNKGRTNDTYTKDLQKAMGL